MTIMDWTLIKTLGAVTKAYHAYCTKPDCPICTLIRAARSRELGEKVVASDVPTLDTVLLAVDKETRL